MASPRTARLGKALNDSLAQLDRGTYVELSRRGRRCGSAWTSGSRARDACARALGGPIEITSTSASGLALVISASATCARGRHRAAVRGHGAARIEGGAAISRARRTAAGEDCDAAQATPDGGPDPSPPCHAGVGPGQRPEVQASQPQPRGPRRARQRPAAQGSRLERRPGGGLASHGRAPRRGGWDSAAGWDVRRRCFGAPALPDVPPHRLPRPAPRRGRRAPLAGRRPRRRRRAQHAAGHPARVGDGGR